MGLPWAAGRAGKGGVGGGEGSVAPQPCALPLLLKSVEGVGAGGAAGWHWPLGAAQFFTVGGTHCSPCCAQGGCLASRPSFSCLKTPLGLSRWLRSPPMPFNLFFSCASGGGGAGAPQNFLALAASNAYTGTTFHRVSTLGRGGLGWFCGHGGDGGWGGATPAASTSVPTPSWPCLILPSSRIHTNAPCCGPLPPPVLCFSHWFPFLRPNTVYPPVLPVPGFMIQGGDVTGTGKGNVSVWGNTFANETSDALRFSARGLLAMANAHPKPDSNGCQFFVTLDSAPHLNGTTTIFGKCVVAAAGQGGMGAGEGEGRKDGVRRPLGRGLAGEDAPVAAATVVRACQAGVCRWRLRGWT